MSQKIKYLFVAGIIGILCSGTFYLYLYTSNQHVNADFEDTGSYLEGALFIKETGGITCFVENCVKGVYKIAEQHPLYLLSLSTVASRDLSFFPKAKLFSITFSIVTIAIFFLIIYRHFGIMYASIGSLLLTLNTSFIIRATNVTVETLLIGLVLTAWVFMYLGSADQKLWVIAGIACGLAFSTKATGFMVLWIFILSSFLIHGRSIIRSRWFWAFISAFFIINLPYLSRNLIVFGNPLYEGINNHVFWLDSWGQISSPRYRLIIDWAEHTYTWRELPTIISYLTNHSVLEIMTRFFSGLLAELNLARQMAFIKGFPFNNLFSYVFLIFAFWGLIIDSNKYRKVSSILLAIFLILPFAWFYQVIPKERYISPLIPIMIFYFVAGIREFILTIGKTLHVDPGGLRYRYVIIGSLMVCVLASQLYFIYRFSNQPLVHPMKLGKDQVELFEWIRQNTDQKSTILLGPTNRYWGYLWYAHYKGKMIGTAGNNPQFVDESIGVFTEYLKEMSVNFIVIHKENYKYPQALINYFGPDPENILKFKEAPPGWEPIFKSTEGMNHFHIFNILRQ